MQNVLIVDDNPLIHPVFSALTRSALGTVEIHNCSTISDALALASTNVRFDLVVLDLGLPGCTGLEALTRFRETFPDARVVIISENESCSTIHAAIKAGAVGYLPKTMRLTEMVSAIRFVASGGVYVPPDALTETFVDQPRRMTGSRAASLTRRQTEILRLIEKGYSNYQIATQLGISEGTVKQHVHALFGVLGVSSRTQAAIIAARTASRAGEAE